jgi:hypothetical protein
VGYEDVSGEGRVVLGFDEVSWAGVLFLLFCFFGMLFIDVFIGCCYRTRSYATTSPWVL